MVDDGVTGQQSKKKTCRMRTKKTFLHILNMAIYTMNTHIYELNETHTEKLTIFFSSRLT